MLLLYLKIYVRLLIKLRNSNKRNANGAEFRDRQVFSVSLCFGIPSELLRDGVRKK